MAWIIVGHVPTRGALSNFQSNHETSGHRLRIFALHWGRRSRDICRVIIITDAECTGYHSPGHPERPLRITGTVERLKHQPELPITWAAPGPVEDTAILRAHTPEILARLKVPQAFDADTPYFENIADYARASVGAALGAM